MSTDSERMTAVCRTNESSGALDAQRTFLTSLLNLLARRNSSKVFAQSVGS